jgi:hypothetical protein
MEQEMAVSILDRRNEARPDIFQLFEIAAFPMKG